MSAFLPGFGPSPFVEVVAYDEDWPTRFESIASLIREALGERVLELHHVGSTSVPGLAAKPTIDIDLVVADPRDEAAYVPALTEAGFVHIIREPGWHEHRLLRYREKEAFVHVFGPGCPEVERHLAFRRWLIDHPDDLAAYAAAKEDAAAEMRRTGGHSMDYNAHKEPVILAIYERMFAALGRRL